MEEKEYKRFTVSVPSQLYEKFEEFRKSLDISRSDCIRKAMNSFLTHEENIDEKADNVVGCITLIMSHFHFKPSTDFQHEHKHEHNEADGHPHPHPHNHPHEDPDGHSHEHSKEDKHIHDYTSKPVYANIQQTDQILSNDIQHHFAEIINSSMHIHLEFERCMEIIAVSGNYSRIKALKDALQKLKSVESLGFFVV